MNDGYCMKFAILFPMTWFAMILVVAGTRTMLRYLLPVMNGREWNGVRTQADRHLSRLIAHSI